MRHRWVPVGCAAVLGALATAAPGIARASVHAAAEPARSCAWEARLDPTAANTAYPDASANYWVLSLQAVPGLHLVIHGTYPHARYISFTSYDPALRAVDGLDDLAIAPDGGSTDPFRSGASRTTASTVRRYTVEVVFGRRPASPAPNTLYTTSADGSHSNPSMFLVVYRVYVADRGLGIDGGTGLPAVSYVGPDGASHAVPACNYPSVPDSGANQRVANAGSEHPGPLPGGGVDPPRYHKFVNAPQGAGQNTENGITGETGPDAGAPITSRFPSGGFLENPDNKYVYTQLNHGFGQLAVVHARLPSTPRTYDGEPVMGTGQLRYWSLCTNDTLSERYYGCLRDDQLHVAADGTFTIVISTAAGRPANALASCNVDWLPWGPLGSTLVIVRNMLPDPSFAQAIQRVRAGDEAAGMGAYYPTTRYLASPADFSSPGCPPPVTAAAGGTSAENAGTALPNTSAAGPSGTWTVIGLAAFSWLARARRRR